jgi:hypothetical protein
VDWIDALSYAMEEGAASLSPRLHSASLWRL